MKLKVISFEKKKCISGFRYLEHIKVGLSRIFGILLHKDLRYNTVHGVTCSNKLYSKFVYFCPHILRYNCQADAEKRGFVTL